MQGELWKACNMLFDVNLTITLDQLLPALLLNYVQITPIPSIVVTFFCRLYSPSCA